jgi:hypothetical protein
MMILLSYLWACPGKSDKILKNYTIFVKKNLTSAFFGGILMVG